MTRPATAQNIEISGVHGGCNDFGTSNCTLLSIYFIIFQRFASNTLSKRLHPRRGAEMGFCKWGLSIFKARSDSRLVFFNTFAILLWSEIRVLKKGANRGCKPAKSDENQLSPPSFHSDIHLSSGRCMECRFRASTLPESCRSPRSIPVA